jgi:hypothetical protein
MIIVNEKSCKYSQLNLDWLYFATVSNLSTTNTSTIYFFWQVQPNASYFCPQDLENLWIMLLYKVRKCCAKLRHQPAADGTTRADAPSSYATVSPDK